MICGTQSLSSETQILSAIKNKTFTVGVIGLGYVGLPLLQLFHNKGFPVLGFDLDQKKINCIENGQSYIGHFDEKKMRLLTDSDRCVVSSHFSSVQNADALLICVPTPLSSHREPDLSYVQNTMSQIIPHLRKNQLIVLESTTYPGTTKKYIQETCEKMLGFKSGEDLYIAYSPEREDPGNTQYETMTIPKVIGAADKHSLKIAQALYGSAFHKTIPVSDLKTAEAVKLLENIFRCVNIALVNELKIIFHEMNIDIHEVIEAAKTKPFGFMPFYPGPGLGGHCIPIDPFYLTWKAREFDINTRFIELAGEINTSMPKYVLSRTAEALNHHKKPLHGSHILCLGITYKPNVDDVRESPAFTLMDLLKKSGSHVSYYDPYVPTILPLREHQQWIGQKSIEWTPENLSSYDAVIIVTDHANIDYSEIVRHCNTIIDTRHAIKEETRFKQLWRA